MAYTKPQFNLLASVWFAGNNPDNGPADVTGIPVQLYIHSKFVGAADRIPPQGFKAQIIIRYDDSWWGIFQNTGIVQIVAADPVYYYLVSYSEKLHVGFPNHYAASSVCHCDGAGAPRE